MSRLTVLQSFGTPGTTSNPYLRLLTDSLTPYVTVRTFSWRAALSRDYDVLHLHWPERLLRGRTRPTTALRLGLFALVLLSTRLRGQCIVRTLHNLEPHERGHRVERVLLRHADHRTGLWIGLNEHTVAPTAAPIVTIPHGHYRDVVGPAAGLKHRRTDARLLFFGLIRPYKGVDELIAAFRGVDDRAATLRIVGRPDDAGAGAAVTAAAGDDPRITISLGFVPEVELVQEILRSQVVVLPYRDMHNSGAALLALSLDRAVLVPDNDVTAALAAEVGPQWVLRYPAPLTAEALAAALRGTAVCDGSAPDLSGREWPASGRRHAEAYRAAATAPGSR